MRLSEHFTLEELTRSDQAQRYNIKNEPNKEQLVNLQFLALNVLEPLRKAWGAPIIVTSGFRCKKVNEIVGGAPNSQHLKGMAADIRPKNRQDFNKLFLLANSMCDFDQLLFEYNKSDGSVRTIHISTHIDVTKNRHMMREKYWI